MNHIAEIWKQLHEVQDRLDKLEREREQKDPVLDLPEQPPMMHDATRLIDHQCDEL